MNNFASTGSTRRIPLGETNANQLSLSQTGSLSQKANLAASTVTKKHNYQFFKDNWEHTKAKPVADPQSNSRDSEHGLANMQEDTEVDVTDAAAENGDGPLHDAPEALQQNQNFQKGDEHDASLLACGVVGQDKNSLVQITPKDSTSYRKRLSESLDRQTHNNACALEEGARRKLTTAEFLRKNSGQIAVDAIDAEYQEEKKTSVLDDPMYLSKNKHIATPITKSRRSIGGASLVNPMYTKILPIQSTVQNIGGKPTLTTVSDKEQTNVEMGKVTNKNTTSGNTTTSRSVGATGTTGVSGTAKNSAAMNLKVWQTNWKNIMKKETVIYFDIQEGVATGGKTGAQEMKTLREKDSTKALIALETLRLGYYSLGAAVSKFFDREVTIVITDRSNDASFIKSLSESDVLKKASKNDMKIWTLEKAERFLTHLDVDISKMKKKALNSAALGNASKNGLVSKFGNAIVAAQTTTETGTLRRYLQNEKLYGPMDRDPLAKRDDMHYFSKDRPHIYIYDLNQQFSPLVIMEWKTNKSNSEPGNDLSKDGAGTKNDADLPYPTLKNSTFGRCPFIADNEDETSDKRIFKRLKKDMNQQDQAEFLLRLYSTTAVPNPMNDIYLLNHDKYNDSGKNFYKKFGYHFDELPFAKNNKNSEKSIGKVKIHEPKTPANKNAQQDNQKSNSPKNNSDMGEDGESPKLPQKVVWKRPPLKNKVNIENLLRMETTGLDDSNGFNGVGKNDTATGASFAGKKRPMLSEIKASGVLNNDPINNSSTQPFQANNGLAATKSTVVGKQMNALNSKFVVMDPVPANCNVPKTPSTHVSVPLKPKERIAGSKISLGNKSPVTRKPNTIAINAAIRDKRMGGGYCENCRVKYESLRLHIKTEKHLEFAQKDQNFYAIDSLIENLHSSMY
ncbi:hypothetical protein ACO0RG_000505 [Hanseniaspora osmophila]|uniref:DDK kinase regulatory subunit DBF4 n=1 Tax=Hanseniaspora osmophila TaxID=56408 RepID=A0A1E5R2B3_9ASCO|nr:DDK kinase regulatory subunit DBF4 [Hanseniaspora osmophila]